MNKESKIDSFVRQSAKPVSSLVSHTQGLGLDEASVAQIDSGKANLRSLRVMSEESGIVFLKSDKRTAGHVVPRPKTVVLMAPLSWRGDYIHDGRAAEPGEVFLSDAAYGHNASRAHYSSLAVGLQVARLEATIRALSGRLMDDVILARGCVASGASGGQLFRNEVLDIARQCQTSADTPGHRVLPKLQENLLYAAAARLIIAGQGIQTRQDAKRSDASVVRSALKDINLETGPIPLADLCAKARVGETRLFEAFVSVFGIPPGQFLQNLRLEHARGLLSGLQGLPTSVKRVASVSGFSNGGRFAAQYRRQFGESPRETLSSD